MAIERNDLYTVLDPWSLKRLAVLEFESRGAQHRTEWFMVCLRVRNMQELMAIAFQERRAIYVLLKVLHSTNIFGPQSSISFINIEFFQRGFVVIKMNWNNEKKYTDIYCHD